jgi:hypothetical protein
MKTHDTDRHPGPWRLMRVDSEFAGIIVAVAFAVLGVVGLPIGRWFLLGAILLGVVFALLIKLLRRR